jgi:predicted nucleic acid-binding protein
MKAGRRVFYWDANVFIAWLKGETCWPTGVIIGMDDVAREVHANKAILFTSTLTSTEIFQGSLTKAEKEKLSLLLQRSNVNQIAPDPRVADRASAIREFYNSLGNKIKTPDAIHLATAIIYKADEMQTMDGLELKSTKKTKLLTLNGDVAGYKLSIVNPYPLNSPPARYCARQGAVVPRQAHDSLIADPRQNFDL